MKQPALSIDVSMRLERSTTERGSRLYRTTLLVEIPKERARSFVADRIMSMDDANKLEAQTDWQDVIIADALNQLRMNAALIMTAVHTIETAAREAADVATETRKETP